MVLKTAHSGVSSFSFAVGLQRRAQTALVHSSCNKLSEEISSIRNSCMSTSFRIFILHLLSLPVYSKAPHGPKEMLGNMQSETRQKFGLLR